MSYNYLGGLSSGSSFGNNLPQSFSHPLMNLRLLESFGLAGQNLAQSQLSGSGMLGYLGSGAGFVPGLSNSPTVLEWAFKKSDSTTNAALGLNGYQGSGVGMAQFGGASPFGNATMNDIGAIVSNLMNPQAAAQRYQYQTHLPAFVSGMTPQQTQSLQINSIFPGGSYQGHTMPGSYGLQNALSGVWANLGFAGINNPFHY